MRITFNLPHVFHESASEVEDAETLQVMLEALIGVNRVYLRHHPDTKSLYRSGVVYGRTKEWESIPAAMARGVADCKTVTAWRIAELREKGVKCRPVFRFRVRRDGGKNVHILVAQDNQSADFWEDPSKVLGMGRDENRPF